MTMAESGLLTLSEVSSRTGISMPTLQRYKKDYQNRIPSEGKGRKQRYPESALPVFEEIKKENVARRGRPRKGRGGRKATAGGPTGSRRGAGRGRKAADSGGGGNAGLLTLTEIGKRTGISYPTLTRYVKLHLGEIPHEGKGRSRRYHPEAVEVFNRLRSQSSGGRKAGGGRRRGGGGRRVAASGTGGGDGRLAQRVQSLEKAVSELTKLVRRPIKVTLSR
jgi:predicted DNA-binding transcriptional regulator AlpA